MGFEAHLKIALVLYKAMYFLGIWSIVLARTERTSFSSRLLLYFKLLSLYF